MEDVAQSVICCGPAAPGGIYLLRIHVCEPLAVAFGRFQGGRSVKMPVGQYLYVGSALGRRGATTLGQRLLRHATRSNNQQPHAIRTAVAAAFEVPLPNHLLKRCFWHIDYLLDRPEVALVQIFALHTAQSLERKVAQQLVADPHTFLIVPGLGARDDPGGTHLLGVNAPEDWWTALPDLLSSCLK